MALGFWQGVFGLPPQSVSTLPACGMVIGCWVLPSEQHGAGIVMMFSEVSSKATQLMVLSR